jgi:CheY-like chemotaxis protein
VNPNHARGTAGPGKSTILIVEDNPDSRDAIRSLLEAYGFDVIEAENGEDGVRKALLHAPDLIVMDIMMPTMDGLSATRTLRGSTEFQQVPIIALTAMAGARSLAIEAGCDAYLPKPVEIVDFLDLIDQLLHS